MNTLHVDLHFPKSILREPYNVESFPLKRRHLLEPATHLNFDVLSLLTKAEFKINQAELFYSQPNFFSGIHSDYCTSDETDISKINWVIGGAESTMNWYEPNKFSDTTSIAVDGNIYVGYQIDEVSLIHSTKLHSPSLIQAHVPHNVITLDEPRWAVSLTLFDTKTKKYAKFAEVVKRLANYI
jgi:hypothetical protein